MKLRTSESTLLKIVSVLFAVVLWLYVLGTESSQIVKNMSVEYILPKGMSISNEGPSEVEFILQGPRAFMRTILDSDEKLLVDLNRYYRKGGKTSLSFRPKDEELPIPIGVSVLKVDPEVVNIKLEREARKEIKIVPNYYGKLDSNYRLVEAKIVPDTLKISGPASLVQGLSEVKTQIIDLSTLNTTDKKEISLLPLDSRLSVEIDGKMEFRFTIKPIKANLSINNVKIRYLTSSKVIKSSHRTCSLLVLAKDGDKTKILASEVEVIADIPERRVGKMTIPLRAKLPDNLHLLEIHPDKIFVTVK